MVPLEGKCHFTHRSESQTPYNHEIDEKHHVDQETTELTNGHLYEIGLLAAAIPTIWKLIDIPDGAGLDWVMGFWEIWELHVEHRKLSGLAFALVMLSFHHVLTLSNLDFLIDGTDLLLGPSMLFHQDILINLLFDIHRLPQMNLLYHSARAETTCLRASLG